MAVRWSLLWFWLALLPGVLHAIEEPAYTVVAEHEVFEVRAYAGYIVAEVQVPGSRAAADRDGFRLLFRYISGANRPAQQLAMTAPVTTTAIEPTEIPMTAPVSRIAEEGGHRVQFVLPAGYTLETAPEPTDPRVQLREIAPMRVAVIRYSGSWSARNEQRHLRQLEAGVASAGLKVVGAPVLSRFNAPYVPTFFRRNEIWLPVASG
ncbi:MAG: heme-binding protein [Xanthomonadales bacterium]|jgi:hypothetical protein|nr:heme-binding protein [Xanthomonadales bacterium]